MMPAGAPPTIAVSTTASTASLSTTDAIGKAVLGVFQDPKVQTSIGGALGEGINSVLGQVIPGFGGESADAKAAREAAAKAARDAAQTQMLIIGGAVVVVLVIVAVIVLRSR